MPTMHSALLKTLGLALALFASVAAAQTYPSKPVRLILLGRRKQA